MPESTVSSVFIRIYILRVCERKDPTELRLAHCFEKPIEKLPEETVLET